jgi:uncharacterized protein YneF (UPF0154 family)
MLNLDDFLQIGVVAIMTGFGSAIGNYLAQRSFVKHLEKLRP